MLIYVMATVTEEGDLLYQVTGPWAKGVSTLYRIRRKAQYLHGNPFGVYGAGIAHWLDIPKQKLYGESWHITVFTLSSGQEHFIGQDREPIDVE